MAPLGKISVDEDESHCMKKLDQNKLRIGGRVMVPLGKISVDTMITYVFLGWGFDSASGYYYNQASGYYYDQNSGLYYSDVIGKWVKQEEAFASTQVSAADSQDHSVPKPCRPAEQPLEAPKPIIEGKDVVKPQSGPAPGLVVSAPQHPTRPTKGAPSSVSVNKRKRDDRKPKVVSKEEEAALKAREAAKKRVEEREKSLLGLYKYY